MPSATEQASNLDFTVYQNTINGNLVDTTHHRHGINPSTGKPNPEVPVATRDDLDQAVKSARAAFKKWKDIPMEERKKAIQAYVDAIEANSEGLAKLLTQEQGKPTFQATMEVKGAIGLAQGLMSISIPEEIVEDNEQKRITVRYTPLGVVGGIVPWNFPIMLSLGKIVPSILMGCPIIIKPSPFTPYTALKLVELAQNFFPPGVVQALSGNDDLGPWMTSHPDIDKISFTGSSATGKLVMASASKTLKRVTLELGGNDPAIICKSVDIQKVAPKIAQFAFMNSGQICCTMKRIYVHSSIYEEFRDAMVATAKTLKAGDGFDSDTFCGPIQNRMQFEKVKTFFEDIGREGWNVAVGGKNPGGAGYFITPTIIDRPDDNSRIVTEEPFGPIVPLLSWDNEEDVIERANNTRMGLGASVWSSDISEAEKIAKRLEAGSVWVNNHLDMGTTAPFAGHKESGVGVEWGQEGLKHFCNVQALYVEKSIL